MNAARQPLSVALPALRDKAARALIKTVKTITAPAWVVMQLYQRIDELLAANTKLVEERRAWRVRAEAAEAEVARLSAATASL